MKDQEYIVACPLCGKVLLKGKSVVGVEMLCPRCNNRLGIAVEGDGVHVHRQQGSIQGSNVQGGVRITNN